ncbi:MAG: pseudouridine synthase [Verrucomicrobiota bacterium]
MSRLPRIDQTLSRLGYATRREAASLAKRGSISTANGTLLKKSDTRHDPGDLLFEGEPLEAVNGLYIMFHKPAGLVCSHEVREGPSIYDMLPARWLRRNPLPASIGRLDKDTTGLILITDDGTFNHRLTSPKHDVQKTYELEVDTNIPEHAVALFAEGSLILKNEDKPCRPAELQIKAPRKAQLILGEGRFHQVKRMMEAVGCTVTKLHRSQIGTLKIGDLKEGAWRALNEAELLLLKGGDA